MPRTRPWGRIVSRRPRITPDMSPSHAKRARALEAHAPRGARLPRARLLLSAVLLCVAVAFLSYRVLTPPPPPRLHLDEDVPLAPPPPLPADDGPALRERLLRMQNRLALAHTQPEHAMVRLAVG